MEWIIALALGASLGILVPQARRHWLSTIAWLVVAGAVVVQMANNDVEWLGLAFAAATIGAALFASKLFAERDEHNADEPEYTEA